MMILGAGQMALSGMTPEKTTSIAKKNDTKVKDEHASQASVDWQLVQKVQKGDKRAFDMLVVRYQHKVCHIVSRYMGDQAEIMDVTQEVFIRAYRAIPNFRGESAFYTWLYRIAVNAAKNYVVSQTRRPPKQDVESDVAEKYDGSGKLCESDTPEALMMRDELEVAVEHAIEALPDNLRSALLLREIDGLTYDEIAVVLKCPVGTVRSRIFRAREAVDKVVHKMMY